MSDAVQGLLSTAQTHARSAARAGAFAGYTATMLGVFLAHARARGFEPDTPAWSALLASYRKGWLANCLALLGVDVVVEGGEPPPPRGPRLVVANHRAALDIPISVYLYGGEVLSRAEIADWPLFGKVARVAGTIFVDREEGGSRVAAARTIRKRLREGHTVIVFPEGTTHAGDEVRAFQAGAFLVGREMDELEIAPLGLAYAPGCEYTEDSFVEHLTKTTARPRTRVVARVGEPFRAAGRGPRELAEQARERVQQLVREARARFDRDA